jgi:hypothetical protein
VIVAKVCLGTLHGLARNALVRAYLPIQVRIVSVCDVRDIGLQHIRVDLTTRETGAVVCKPSYPICALQCLRETQPCSSRVDSKWVVGVGSVGRIKLAAKALSVYNRYSLGQALTALRPADAKEFGRRLASWPQMLKTLVFEPQSTH